MAAFFALVKACEYQVGTYALLASKNLKIATDRVRKMSHRFVGPFKILKKITSVAYDLDLSRYTMFYM